MLGQIQLRIAALSLLSTCVLAVSCKSNRVHADESTEPGPQPINLYRDARAEGFNPPASAALPRVYVPDVKSDDVYVIDPATYHVVDRFKVGRHPQHIIPSWDLKTLWVANNAGRGAHGSLTPIDPTTATLGRPVPVEDPYNLYFTPDGQNAIVVAERLRRLDFLDPHTLRPRWSLATTGCGGINHADFARDEQYAIFTCEFTGGLVKVDFKNRQVLGYLKLSRGGMPQDIRVTPDGSAFLVADMMADGVFVIDGDAFKEIGFIPTGIGAHGLYPSRDGTKLYVSNRGSHRVNGPAHGPGSVSIVDFATRSVIGNWTIPGGGSPDMGNVSADGKQLWLSGRFDNVVYAFDTSSGAVKEIPVGREPHGLTVWPQPGRYSLGHTGNMR